MIDTDSQYCANCGESVGDAVEPTAAASDDAATDLSMPIGDATTAIGVELVPCPTCGASNAARRTRCGRCETRLQETRSPTPTPRLPAPPTPVTTAPASPGSAPDPEPPRPRMRRIGVLVVVIGLVVGAAIGVAVGVGFGPFSSPEPVEFATGVHPDEPVAIRPVRAGASTVRPGTGATDFGAGRELDGDQSTAWVPTMQDSAPRLVHEFDGPAWVGVIEVTTGIDDAGRVTRARIDLGTLILEATIEDVSGTQVIRLPRPVLLDTTVWQVQSSEGGAGALAEIRYLGWTATDSERAAFTG